MTETKRSHHKKPAAPADLAQTANCREIESYWRGEGHAVTVTRKVVTEIVDGRRVTYVKTLSTLRNGLPLPKGAAAAETTEPG